MSDWRPSASGDRLRARAALLSTLRKFFSERDVLEVETPLLSRFAITDPQLESASLRMAGLETEFFLHTSPEFFMKRMLAAGSGDIWQLCKVVRGAEQGRWHNPEFSLLEWYRVGFDHHRLMEEVAELLATLLPQRVKAAAVTRTYREVFVELADIDPFAVDDASLRELGARQGVDPAGLDRDACLDLVASHVVYPQLGQGRVDFVTDFPASQAALARLNSDRTTAARFEAFVDGVELANGFHELGDAAEQRRRFDAENARRRQRGLTQMPVDELLLEALDAGLPDCAGVAVGFDRVVMLATGAERIADVLSFDFSRA